MQKLEITDGADALLIVGGDLLNDTRCAACGSLLFSVVREGEWAHVALGSLVDDPTMQERLIFGPRFVGITRVTLRRVVGDEEEWITTQPAYYWKFAG